MFHFYIVPRYIEPMLSVAANILNDDDVMREISEAAKELSDKGLIDGILADNYIKSVEKRHGTENGEAEEEPNDEDDGSSGEFVSENSVGAKSVKVQSGDGKKYGYGNQEKKNNTAKSDIEENLNDSEKDLYSRVKSDVSSKDWARAYELASKFDMSKVRALLSDRAALKNYIRSVLTEEEYAEAMELYLKYAYLIK